MALTVAASLVTMAKYPVYDMKMAEEKAAATSEYKGKTYYLCSKGCKVKPSKCTVCVTKGRDVLTFSFI